MTKKSCLHNKDLLTFLLRNIEASPDATFYESELRSYANSDFDTLSKNKYLKWVQYDPENEPYYSSRLGDSGNERFISRVNGKIYAYSTEDSGISRIELRPEDINRWSFDIQTLLQEIKKANALSGHVTQLDERLYLIGDFDSGARQFGVCLGLFADEGQVKSLIGIRQRIKHYEYVLVLCPTYEIIDQGLINSLEKQKVICYPFLKIFLKDSFQIDFDLIKSPPEATEAKFIIPELNATEKRKYAKDYPRRDVIEFTDKEGGSRSYIVMVNGQAVRVQYGIFVLLVYLVIVLKREVNLGWITREDIEREGIVNAENITHLHRLVSELKKLINPYVENGQTEIIENIKKKSKYRLATMPSRVRAPHRKWLTAKYNKIKDEVIKERQKRKGNQHRT